MLARRLIGLSLSALLVFSMMGTAEAKPWVRKASLDGRYSGKVVPQNCYWVPAYNGEDWWYRYRVAWDFTPTWYGATFRWDAANIDVKLNYVEGEGYYLGRDVSGGGRYVTRYKLWVTKQIRLGGGYIAYEIEGTRYFYKKSAPATHHSLAIYTLIRKGG